MASFTDKKGRIWNVDLDLRLARIIDKSDFKEYWDRDFSILALDMPLIQKLLSDGPFLFAVIWAMVRDQAEEKFRLTQTAEPNSRRKPALDAFPVSPKEDPEAAEIEFVSGVNGPTIEAARAAFVEAMGDFFPETKIVLSAILRQTKKMGLKAEKKIEEAEPLLEQMLDEEFEANLAKVKRDLEQSRKQRLGEVSTKSPAT